MRHNQNRRSRGRSRKGPNPLTRSFESNGPDVKVRGTAAHVAEKYVSLARDAHASGDIVAAENYLQHAEHYTRIVMAAQAQLQQSQPQFRDASDEGYDDERQMNGRPRDRFEFNGDSRNAGDDEGDERMDAGDDEGERSFRPRPRFEDRDRPRGPRERFQFRDRPERSEQDERAEPSPQMPDPQDQPQPDVVEAAPPVEDEERPSQPQRRRRARPRTENGEAGEVEGQDATPDGAAALAAFRD
jgi:hypothetical protein